VPFEGTVPGRFMTPTFSLRIDPTQRHRRTFPWSETILPAALVVETEHLSDHRAVFAGQGLVRAALLSR
jgi:hypothetical protein